MALVRVGRWMSRAEYEAMRATGHVQESGTGQTSVTRPANPTSYRAAPRGSLFVAFSLPEEALITGGRADWAIVIGPSSIYARRAAAEGRLVPRMPRAVDLEVVIA